MGLRLKANLLLVGGATLVLLIAGPALRAFDHADAVRQARQHATLLTRQVEIAGRYTADRVMPLFSGIGPRQLVFVPQSAPFFASLTTARMMRAADPDIDIRQVALDPAGAFDRPTGEERAAIERLRAEPHAGPIAIERDKRLTLISPLRSFPGACATCYPSRQSAPAGLLDVFGAATGFNSKPGEIVGATIATVPLPLLRGADAAMAWLVAAMMVLVALFNLVLELLVLRPLGRLAAVAELVSLGRTGVEEFDTAGSDQIGAIARSFNRLRRSMESAIGLIES